jgi:hypothetical protein
MRRPRMTIRGLLAFVAAIAASFALARLVSEKLGPRPGAYHGRYWYFDRDWRYHEVRGAVILVTDHFILAD